MYKGIKSKVQIGHHVSYYFMCKVGVRHGENLSPFLFSIYINDLEDYLLRNGVNGFNCKIVIKKLLMVLYANLAF